MAAWYLHSKHIEIPPIIRLCFILVRFLYVQPVVYLDFRSSASFVEGLTSNGFGFRMGRARRLTPERTFK